jgi:hypothetical protein
MRRPIWIFLAAAGCAVAAPSGEERLSPPIAGPLIPASSFGEYRSTHYHGGLDFSTGGREGVPVLAPRSGWVYRVRASGLGYGRSVYFRMDDARTVVYGHLSRFERRLAAFVDAQQDRRGTYEVDLYPKPESLAYAAGDTLAYSGQSGAGPPHLHAEVRTGKDASVSVNPWLAGWAPPDSVAPHLSRLRVEPAVPGVLVNGGLDPVLVSLARTPPPTLRISGRVRLWVETWDPVPTGSRMAPYRVSVKMGGQVLEQVVFDAVDWNWAREVNWTYHAPSARSRDAFWIALESPPGGRLHLALAEKDWTDDLTAGPHPLTIEVADAAGNTAQAVVSLIKEERAPEVPVAAVKKTSIVSRGSYLEIRLAGRTADLHVRDAAGKIDTPNTTRLPARGGTVFQIGRPDHPGAWSFFAGDSLLGRAFWLPGPETGFSWKRGADSVRVEAGPAAFTVLDDASYGPLWVLLRSAPAPRVPAGGGELEPVSDIVALEPWAMPLRDDARAAFSVSGTRRGLALMSRETDGWDFVDADTSGGKVRGRVGSLETLAVFRDRTPPKIRILAVTGGRNARLRAAIRDQGVGLAVRSLVFVLDGRDVISEWDVDAGVLIGHLRSPIPPGPHELAVEAGDRVGNRSRARLAFTVR